MANVTTLTCAFCKGKGKDPFEIMSKEATCQVCGGRGEVTVVEPYVPCAHCQATGVSPGSRNVCTSCNGRGAVSVADLPRGKAGGKRDTSRYPSGDRKVCPECGGSGTARESNLPCLTCSGKGVAYVLY